MWEMLERSLGRERWTRPSPVIVFQPYIEEILCTIQSIRHWFTSSQVSVPYKGFCLCRKLLFPLACFGYLPKEMAHRAIRR